MHVRVRFFGHPESTLVVESKLTKIEQFRHVIRDKFNVAPELQRLIYGGKLLENGYTFHDYNIKLNDVIQLLIKKKVQSDDEENNAETKSQENGKAPEQKNIEYKDATSTLYKVGDLIDAKQEGGYWLEGTITRIVQDPEAQDNDKSETNAKIANEEISDVNILFKVKLDQFPEDEEIFKITDIRPRARKEINAADVQVGQTVMLNHNIDEPGQIGHWYDFKVDQIKKRRNCYKFIGTLFLGTESVPLNNATIEVIDKVFTIEVPVSLSCRSKEYSQTIAVEPPKRIQPIKCDKCGDDEDLPCKFCGCYKCSGKDLPEEIILCDECDNGFHLKCLTPPLTAIPVDDWYCHDCKRDVNDVVAPGAATQTKKTTGSKTTRDWGRGMACVGKTKDCAMPPNHFGPIPGVEVGMIWRYRVQLSEIGLHRPSVSGIHGRDAIGAFSIVLSGGYEDDVDNGYEFTYTGSGGRDLSGNKRTAGQSCDQKFKRENRALARNCAAKSVSEKGGDAGADWRKGKPVRVVRSYKMLKAFPKYAPIQGLRYDGIYKVVKYYPENGLSGFRVYKYLLRRDDPSPAPWEPNAKQFDIVYPDGYIEAEAQKLKLKQKKIKTKDTKNESSDSDTQVLSENTTRKRKRSSDGSKEPNKKTKDSKSSSDEEKENVKLTASEQKAIDADNLNVKLWAECLEICQQQSKKEFIEHVMEAFRCIICQGLAVFPVTTPCLHNFCLSCMKRAFKTMEKKACPYCRQELSNFDLTTNNPLMGALRTILPGYDAGQK